MFNLRKGIVKHKTNQILANINIKIFPGEISVIIGQNGVGKTSLANAIAAIDSYSIISTGNCCEMKWNTYDSFKASKMGIFISFQYPVELPGVIYIHFLKAITKISNNQHLLNRLTKLIYLFDINHKLIYKPVNIGFSGGEKKIFETIQLILMQPKLCILDELDSGLDVNKLIIFSKVISSFSVSNRTILIITHNSNLLKYVSPDSIYHLTATRTIYVKNKLYSKVYCNYGLH